MARGSPIHEDTEQAEILLKSDVKNNKQKISKQLAPTSPIHPQYPVVKCFPYNQDVHYLNKSLLILHN